MLFSAAVPGQGGTGHLNEQWPRYWIDRFEARGWSVLDCLRGPLWCNPRVAYYYAQNLLLFASAGWTADGLDARPDLGGLPLIHPRTFELAVESAYWRTDRTPLSLRQHLP